MAQRAKRPRKQTDGPAYHDMLTRIIPNAGRRAGNDVGELPYLADCHRMMQEAMTNAVVELRMTGHTWDEIGAAMGLRRQFVHRTYADAVTRREAADAAARAALAVSA